MLCQACGQAEACIHYFESIGGNTKTLNLCSACAERQGVEGLSFPLIPIGPAPVKAVQMELVLDPAMACVGCGKTLADYRHDPKHACPACHDSFASPRDLRRRLGLPTSGPALLKARLEQALAAEDYESAARLRDLLRDSDPEAGALR